MDYTVLGDAVNVAARLCANAQRDQTLISSTTYNALGMPDDLLAVPIAFQLKGKREAVQAYDIRPQLALQPAVGNSHGQHVAGSRVVRPEASDARGDKSAYSDKQKRKAERIEESYESRGVPEDEAERRAWATVNKKSGGGKRSGSGRGRPESNVSSRKGGRIGGKASASRPAADRSAVARKAAATRKRNAARR